MILSFGKLKGRTTEYVLLKHPAYVRKVLLQNIEKGPLLAVKNDFLALIKKFDRKPLTVKCCLCNEPATRLSFYLGSTYTMAWCSECDPRSISLFEGRFEIFNDYRRALRFVSSHCGGKKGSYKHIIKTIYSCKGLSERAGEKHIQAFFAD